ncbi:hypothetical protein QWI17_07970 [Gilvimarinus sp. SDUM040013]|uniref:AsmA domain-containing protein n=1 Tax=Gilvimarinus gilvus TaxID=3058038 RepID=A0ABU4S459_9GAMM|nr:hypothetical protein [Gilvimarinus sp. SDUM040013]MDO3385770.1 hypothetical protein [Gilvimarinus sp. SDUM040013]MDX6850668.1 hypothetical protein [Gilvimarinus sp. SDUM040013]
MKVLKVLLIILLVLVLIIGGCSYWVYKNIDGFVATTIESVGTELLQTPVTLDSANFTLSEARAELHGFSIENFSGFSEPTLFTLNQVAVDIDPSSLESNIIVFDEILIDGLQLTMEQLADGHTNLQELHERLAVHKVDGANSTEPAQGAGAEPKFVIRRLAFTNVTTEIISPLMEQKTYQLNDIVRENLGDREGGVTAKELAAEIFQPVADHVTNLLREKAGSEINNLLQDNLSEEDAEQLKDVQQLLERQ